MLGDEVVDKIYPPIISQEVFSRVRAKVDANKYGRRSVAVVYLLRHKIKCGYCGESIIAECGEHPFNSSTKISMGFKRLFINYARCKNEFEPTFCFGIFFTCDFKL